MSQNKSRGNFKLRQFIIWAVHKGCPHKIAKNWPLSPLSALAQPYTINFFEKFDIFCTKKCGVCIWNPLPPLRTHFMDSSLLLCSLHLRYKTDSFRNRFTVSGPFKPSYSLDKYNKSRYCISLIRGLTNYLIPVLQIIYTIAGNYQRNGQQHKKTPL